MKISMVLLCGAVVPSHSFIQTPIFSTRSHAAHASYSVQVAISSSTQTSSDTNASSQSEFPPILMELRDVAMKLHTKEQAPREGQAAAPAKPEKPFVPTQADYLKFLVDSCEVYKTLEDIVNNDQLVEELGRFRNTGLERTTALEKDVKWMCDTYNLDKPEVGRAGRSYSETLKSMITISDDGTKDGIPEFMCHYYNFVFAHLAGGRMIGKQMSKMLLDGETLEFYKVRDVLFLSSTSFCWRIHSNNLPINFLNQNSYSSLVGR